MKGRARIGWFRGSDFSEVFLALDRVKHELVVIKKVKSLGEIEYDDSVFRFLNECESPYVTRYYDILQRERELWVNCSRFR